MRLTLVPSLDIVGSLAHRWHRLSIIRLHGFDEDESNDTTLAQFIIKRFNHLQFPSLKYVAISYWNTSLDFLSPSHAPVLEHLKLNNFVAKHANFPPITALKILNLDFYGFSVDNPSFLTWFQRRH